DTREELERIAGWCREGLLARADARLLVVWPGAAGARERLAALIRQALDPAGALAGSRAPSRVAIEGGQPLAQRPMIAQALATLVYLAGAESDFEAFSRWLRAPYWGRPAAPLRARLDVRLRERPMVRLRLRDFLVALGLVPADLQPTARELNAQLTGAAATLGEGSASPRLWSERFAAALSAAGWPGPLGAQVASGVPAASAAHRLAQARAQLAAWRRSADELILSAPAHAEDLELLPSPLLAGTAPEPLPRRCAWLPARLRREGLTE